MHYYESNIDWRRARLATEFGQGSLGGRTRYPAGLYVARWSRPAPWQLLAGGAPVTEIEKVRKDADVYIISVKDSVLPDLVQALCSGRSTKVFLHTAGSVNMDVFAGHGASLWCFLSYAVVLKEKTVSFHDIPCFVEANDDYARDVLMQLAQGLTTKIYQLSSEDQKVSVISRPSLLVTL